MQVGQLDENRGWNVIFASFIFGQHRLIDTGFELQRQLCQIILLADFLQVLQNLSPILL